MGAKKRRRGKRRRGKRQRVIHLTDAPLTAGERALIAMSELEKQEAEEEEEDIMQRCYARLHECKMLWDAGALNAMCNECDDMNAACVGA